MTVKVSAKKTEIYNEAKSRRTKGREVTWAPELGGKRRAVWGPSPRAPLPGRPEVIDRLTSP